MKNKVYYKNLLITTKDEQYLGAIAIQNNVVVDLVRGQLDSVEAIDCKQNILMPAFIDSHTHGGYGFSFDDILNPTFSEDLLKYKNKLNNEEGVAAVVASTVTHHIDEYFEMSKKYLNLINTNPFVISWFLEGPFISKEKCGAHDPELTLALEEKHLELFKNFKKNQIIIGVAPERDSVKSVMEKHSDKFIFSIGHSNAYDLSNNNFLNKHSKRIIHLFNGMSTFDHRKESIVNTVLENVQWNKDYNVEIIADGHHINNDVVKLVYKILPKNVIAIISDSLAQKGLKNDIYKLNKLFIEKKDDLFYLKDSNNLAGSGMPYNLVLNNFQKATGASYSEMVRFSSYNVAKQLNINDQFGIIELNKPSNLVIISPDFQIIKSFMK